MRLITILVFLSLVTGCGVRPKPRILGSGEKHLGRFNIGSEKRYEVTCMEGGMEETYIWVKVGSSSSAFDNEKRMWNFVGRRKKDGKVLRVISPSCRMVTEDLI